MKSTSFSIPLILLFNFFFLATPKYSYCQQDVDVYHNLKLRALFKDLHRQPPMRDLLYEMSVHRVDIL